ncbi:MAG: aldo/keto reductase [Gammaproteobacteria bacterium]|nr:aldo/keto reductase [Gammaproteobacteria bacterium]
MEMRVLGRTGVSVSKICFGVGMFGYFGNTDEKECARMVDIAIDAGVNYFDTSDQYSHGESETILGKALSRKRDDVVVATKFSLPMTDNPNHRGNSRRWIMREVESSLKRLNTDYIDLYQVHRPDITTDIDETLGALSDLVRAGKVRMLGSSTFPAEQIVEAQWVSDRRGRERFMVEQPPYSIFARRIEADVLPTCQRYGMGVVVWSPLSQGWLTGKWRRDAPPNDTNRQNLQPHLYDMTRADNQRKLDLIEKLDVVARDAGMSLMHMAIAFVCAHPAVTSAIIGPRTPAQLEGLLEGAEVTLDDDVLDAIDAIVAPGLTLSRDDDGYVAPEIANKTLRRRYQREQVHLAARQTVANIEAFREKQGKQPSKGGQTT